MVLVKPFKAVRPVPDKVNLVAARSLHNYSPDYLKEKLEKNSYTFLHVINPKITDNSIKISHSEEHLLDVKKRYNRLLEDNIFVNDHKESLYIYRQTKNNHSYVGIIGCACIDDYFSGAIKIHEQTLTALEDKMISYLEACDFNAEPICMCYPDHDDINAVTDFILETKPIYDFYTSDHTRHTVWGIWRREHVEIITSAFGEIPSIYIADGHHRSASCALLGQKKRDQNPEHTGAEEYNNFLCIFYPESQLKIYDFNRVVKDLNQLSLEIFLRKLEEKFVIHTAEEGFQGPSQIHEFGMYLQGRWYVLSARQGIIHEENPISSLDAAILTDYVLSPLLDIHDLKTDNRIAFVPGVKGMAELEKQVDSGEMKIAFAMYPVSIDQMKRVADTNNIMPPKTTWVEPKQMSGLLIYPLS